MREKQHGLTLVEILIVVAIIGILAAITGAVAAPRALKSARDAAVISKLQQCAAAFNIYRSDHNDAYPGSFLEMGFYKRNKPEYIARGAYEIVDDVPSFPGSWYEPPKDVRSLPPQPNFKVVRIVYQLTWPIQNAMNKFKADEPFDEEKDHIFGALFRKKDNPKREFITAFSGPEKSRIPQWLISGSLVPVVYSSGAAKWVADPYGTWRREVDWYLRYVNPKGME